MGLSRKPLARHLGKFSIARASIQDRPEMIQKVFKNMIVIQATNSFITDTVDYTAMSYKFRPIAIGYQVPYYTINITETSNKRHYFKFKEEK